MIISIDAEEAFKKMQHPFMTKKKKKNLSRKSAYKEPTYLNMIKAKYDRLTANVILSHGEKLKAFPLRSGKRQGYSHHYYST